jgi:hypothetical protein
MYYHFSLRLTAIFRQEKDLSLNSIYTFFQEDLGPLATGYWSSDTDSPFCSFSPRLNATQAFLSKSFGDYLLGSLSKYTFGEFR